ncbi:MAG: hypothetical protein PVG83_10995 [Acidimicrobiia bacterium]
MKAPPRLRRLAMVLIGVIVLVIPTITARGGAGLDSNLASAFGRLGLTEVDMVGIFASSLEITDPELYRFAAALEPPSVDPADAPWGVPARIGVTRAVWPDSDLVPSFPGSPEVVEGALFLPHGGPLPETEYFLMWAQMNGPVPVDPPDGQFQQWSFPFASPGSTIWQPLPQFPNDTWANASAIPHISYGPGPHALSMSIVAADGALLDQDFNGFGLVSGDTIIIGVDTDTLFPNGTSGVTFGFAGHIHDGGFGATPESASLISYATGLPGTLVPIPSGSLLVVGAPQPTSTTITTTTTTPSSTTTVQPTTTTTDVSVVDESPDESSGFPWLPVLLGALGAIVVFVGGRLYLLNARDPCAEDLLVWNEAEKACDEARELASKTRRDCEKAAQRVADLEKLHRDLCTKWPPACEGEGSSAEGAGLDGMRVTTRDLHARRVALGRLWDDYQSGRVSAQDVHAAWEHANTPEFREELRQKTTQKIAQREKLEADVERARGRRDDLCRDVDKTEEAAQIACDKAASARAKYDECVEEQNAETFVNALFNLGSRPPQEAEPQSPPVQPELPEQSTPEPPRRKVDVPVTFEIDKTGHTGAELSRAERLERVFRLRRGTGDLALVAKDLWQFNNWHIATFGEPWFTWSASGGNPNSVTSTSGSTERFMQTRVMACYEFVHFCAYIASDQLGRQRTAGDPGEEVFLDEYSVDWGFSDSISTDAASIDGEAPSGTVLTASFRWGEYDNSAGYYHTGISIGNGKVISLGSDGLILEDATGMVDACFPSVAYTDVRFGDYAWGRTNPAPK